MVPVMASLKVCESRYSPNKCFIYSNTVFVEFSSFFAGFNGTTPPPSSCMLVSCQNINPDLLVLIVKLSELS